jgi:hypothetical protein
MKRIFLFAFLVIAFSACTKDAASVAPALSSSEVSALIVGKWQLVETGRSVSTNSYESGKEGCGEGTSTQSSAKTTVAWQKAGSDEKVNFLQNGDYNKFLQAEMTCKGSYRVADGGTLAINADCATVTQGISGLSKNTLTVRDGEQYLKYQKVD